jgi:hypothetical protein
VRVPIAEATRSPPLLVNDMPERRFPPPWSVEELAACFVVVRGGNGQQLAYAYFEGC